MSKIKNRGACSDETELEELKEAARRNDVIEKYITKEITYRRALGLTPCSKTTFYKLLKKYDENTGSTAFLLSKRGRKR